MNDFWYDVLWAFIPLVGMCLSFEYGRLFGMEQARRIAEEEVRRAIGGPGFRRTVR